MYPLSVLPTDLVETPSPVEMVRALIHATPYLPAQPSIRRLVQRFGPDDLPHLLTILRMDRDVRQPYIYSKNIRAVLRRIAQLVSPAHAVYLEELADHLHYQTERAARWSGSAASNLHYLRTEIRRPPVEISALCRAIARIRSVRASEVLIDHALRYHFTAGLVTRLIREYRLPIPDRVDELVGRHWTGVPMERVLPLIRLLRHRSGREVRQQIDSLLALHALTS